MSYEYKVTPFIGVLKKGQTAEVVAQQLEALINLHASHGWEFTQLGSANIEIQPGCLEGLSGKSASYVTFDQVIFRRSKNG